MKTFGAEAPRSEIDRATLTLACDDQGFVILGVSIPEQAISATIRIGQPTAKDMAETILVFLGSLK